MRKHFVSEKMEQLLKKNKSMEEKNKTQKGFISIILIIVIAVIVVLSTAGIVKYKDEITANVSNVFKSKIETPNVESIEKDEEIKESDLTEEPIIEKEVEAEKKQNDAQQLQEQLRTAEQKRLEAEKQLAEEKAKQEAEKTKEEAEKLKKEAEYAEREDEDSLRKIQEDTVLKIAQCQATARVQTDAYLNKAYQMADEAILPKIKEFEEQIKQLQREAYQAGQEPLTSEEIRLLTPQAQIELRQRSVEMYNPSIQAAKAAKQDLEIKLVQIKSEARLLFEQGYNKLYLECLKK